MRADARRNRDRLLAVARAAFTSGKPLVLEDVAREAGVGIGTLYRHFPSREALIGELFSAERAALCARAESLLADHEPVTALRLWMDAYADFVATKRGMAETLKAIITMDAGADAEARENLDTAVRTLLSAGARQGRLRPDTQPEDLLTALVGILLATDDSAQTARLFDLLIAGLRPETATP
ncbi:MULTISPECIES: TetR/AcrR family transcriptional regulator [Actinomadura]|uniref:DNA-binding transcriptional regulator, AcrR family n=1 Tax=Actinomadura madurae TaxID=1993 RepID=A0A1I5X9H4_9ACTN|nr:TetR/AcrR family transcriptional regulator [Actinomadura madurae]SFQ28629.1 DNA-binding transcriptional regulator, AcrR family [Actinomadura madurae]SPT59102.1 Bacterial regulatory proteins, tetR family [Actinomadura madurae]